MDPISLSVTVICSTMKIVTSLNKFSEARQREKLKTEEVRKHYERLAQAPAQARDEAAEKARLEELRKRRTDAARNDILFVMTVLGQHLLQLELVNYSQVPSFTSLVEQNVPDEEWAEAFKQLDQTLKYTSSIGIFLCAECAPMPIYRGFGAMVLNNFK